MGFEPRPSDCSGCKVSGLQHGATTLLFLSPMVAPRVTVSFDSAGPALIVKLQGRRRVDGCLPVLEKPMKFTRPIQLLVQWFIIKQNN